MKPTSHRPSSSASSDSLALTLALARHRLRWRVVSIGPPDSTGLRRVRMACDVGGHSFPVGGGWFRDPADVRAEQIASKPDTRPFAFGGQFATPPMRQVEEFEPAEGLALGDLDGLAGAIGWDLEEGIEGLCEAVRRASVEAWGRWRRGGGEVGQGEDEPDAAGQGEDWPGDPGDCGPE